MKRRMVALLGIVIFVIVGNLALNNEDGKAREERLVAEYQAIKHPEGAKLINYELNRKIIKRWIHSRYNYPISNDEIARYYEQELVGKGWRQRSYNSRPGNVGYLYFKENLELLLALKTDNSWSLTMDYPDAKY